MIHVRISYSLTADANIEHLKTTVKAFVARLNETEGVTYTSYQLKDKERSFMHLGTFPDQEIVKEIQSQSFFGEFSAYLKPLCEEGPSVSWLTQVAG